jgi:hypothetical protein
LTKKLAVFLGTSLSDTFDSVFKMSVVAATLTAALVTTAGASGTHTPLSLLSESQLQILLSKWDLDRSFAELFIARQVTGALLDIVDLDNECLDGSFLSPSEAMLQGPAPVKLQWQLLCSKIRHVKENGVILSASTSAGDFQNSSGDSQEMLNRRHLSESLSNLLADMDDTYSGIRISKDQAMLSMGTEGDVAVARGDLAELLLIAHKAVFAGDLQVNGTLTLGSSMASVPTFQMGSIDRFNGCAINSIDSPTFLWDPEEALLYLCNGSNWTSVGCSGGCAESSDSSRELASCLDTTDGEGLYSINPAGDDDFYSVYCYDNGGMRLRSNFDTYSTYYSTCGGSDDSDCLPSDSDGCYIYDLDGNITSTSCDDSSLEHLNNYQSVDMQYVDEDGKVFEIAALQYFAKYYTTAGSSAQAWIFDSVDQHGYSVRVDYAGGLSASVHHQDYYNGDSDADELWALGSPITPMPGWFGAGKIPTSIDAGDVENIGVAMILADKSLKLTPLSDVKRSCIGAPEGELLIDPANNGDAFMAFCDGDNGIILDLQYDSYSTYYSTCGGSADSDCTPTCDDGCYMETQDGTTLTDYCCDSDMFSSTSQYEYVSIQYLDRTGMVIDPIQLDALVNLCVDTSDPNVKIWFFDATDQNDYDITISFHQNTQSKTHMTDYYIGSDINEWDINNDDNDDLNGLLEGPNKIPSGINAGTLANVGVWVNFPDKQLPVRHVPKSCKAVSFETILEIDPANNGTSFPVYCDGTGRTHLRSVYEGYSTYYSTCGGTEDEDCFPSCSDGCYALNEDGSLSSTCCDAGNNLDTSYESVDIMYVDENGESIPDEQLEALAFISDSSLTQYQIYFFDSEEQSYDPSVEYFGGGTRTYDLDHVTESEDAWGINSNTDYFYGFFGMHRIPKTIWAGSVENLGVYFGIAGATVVLTSDDETLRSCVGVRVDGIYPLDPADTGHAFAGYCNTNWDLLLSTESTLLLSTVVEKTTDMYGVEVDPTQLEYLADNGFDSSSNSDSTLTVSLPDTLTCDFVSGEQIIMADPANDGAGFPLLCNNGKSMLRANVAGVAVYYSTCGGSADDDCTPSCSDGCTIETVNGYDEAICCDNWKTASSESTQAFSFEDEFGESISTDQLDALADSLDSSWTNALIWIYDGTDQDGYELTTSYYGNTADSHSVQTDYYIGEDINEWDRNNHDYQAVADDMEGIFGMNKIPDAVDAGTLANWGVWIGLPDQRVVLSAASRTYSSCMDTPYDGIFLIDPASTGHAFPILCRADGTTVLTSGYSGYSVYYSTCGGSTDSDCTPSCDEGCTIDEFDECCDSESRRHISAASDISFAWVDTQFNLISTTQLNALANMGYNSGVESSDLIWLFDSSDQSGYTLTIGFYGDEADHELVTPSDWYIGSDINEWDINSLDTDLSELQDMFLGSGRIPATMNAGTLANWGVWVHFTNDELVLTPE